MPPEWPHGVELLRRRRGEQRVTFEDVADHLVDFVDQRPDDAAVVEALARFLAEVELVPHDHRLDPERSRPTHSEPLPDCTEDESPPA